MMKRRKTVSWLLSTVLCLCLVLTVLHGACVPTLAADISQPTATVNLGSHDYTNGGRCASPVRSHLVDNGDGTLTRLEYTGENIAVETYSSDLKFIKGFTIDMELPLFGGFYYGSDRNFLVFGQDNFDESDEAEVVRVVSYTRDWKRIGSASLYGANTVNPFAAGSLRFAECGGYLYIRTSRRMYTADDGKNHQANMTLNVRISDMAMTCSFTEVSNIGMGYVSHSFDQYIDVDGTNLVAVDHGDAYPRAVVLTRYFTPAGQDSFLKTSKLIQKDGKYYRVYTENVEILPISGALGANDTGVSIGGFESSDSHYLIAGNAVEQGDNYNAYGQRNIFVSATDKNDFTSQGTTIRYLTQWKQGDGVDVSNPHLVDLENGNYFLIWTETAGSNRSMKYCLLDQKGQTVDDKIYSAQGGLSDCVPIVYNGKLLWYLTNNSAPLFMSVDLNNLDQVTHDHLYIYSYESHPSYYDPGELSSECMFCGVAGESVILPVIAGSDEYEISSVSREPTCTQDGSGRYIWKNASQYGLVNWYYWGPIPATGHSYTSQVTAPTCTESGYTTHTCQTCQNSYTSDPVAALGHSYQTVTVDATCTEDGSVTDTCAACGDQQIEIIPATGHSNISQIITAAGCTTTGVEQFTCSTCGDQHTEIIPATGHSHAAKVTAPTCTEDGFTTYTCHCGDRYVADKVAALGHSYETLTVEATCTEDGSITDTCAACGDTKVQIIAATGHSHTAKVTAPTCTEKGYTTYTCHCGDSYTVDEVAALGHSYETVTLEATCTEDGSITDTCATCGDTKVQIIAATGHSHTAKVTPPTCTENGYTTYTCHCGDTYTTDEVAALGHSYETVTVEVTCTKDGSITDTCAVCGDQQVEVIPATGHSHTAKVTAPTCTEKGYTTYTCHCGDTYIAEEVAALGHSYETVTLEATCTKDGSITDTCATCGDTKVQIIAATGHSHTAKVTAPTCTEKGYTTYTCHCGDTYTAEEVAALGHSYESAVTAPTCTDKGYTTHTCHCGDAYKTDEVAALGHSYKTVTVSPTCTENGSITATCSNCGDCRVLTVLATGHSHTAKVMAPTCTEKGYTIYTCHCGDTYTEDEVAALGHKYQTVIVDATCIEAGSITDTCTVCGDQQIQIIPSDGHTHVAKVTAPTCTEKGYTTYICPCGDTYTEDEVPALGHRYETVSVDATCTEDGYVTDTCSACGDQQIQIIPATGHRYEAVVTAPTCTEKGYTTYSCHCGDAYQTDEVAALGHSYQTVKVNATCTENGSITATCSNCGDTQVMTIVATGHKHQAVVTAPTCTEKGYTTYTCRCGDSYTENEVAALGHSFANGICTVCGAADPDYADPVEKPTLTLKSPTLEFKDMITVNAFFTAENMDAVVEMGMITYREKVNVWNVETADHVIPGTTYDMNTGRYIAHSQGIHAKYLGDTMYLAVYAKLSDGSYVYSKLAPYSPVQYATNQLKNSTDMKLKQLVAAMLNYGAEAQLFFGHNTGSLANASLTAEQKALPESYRADMVSSVPAASAEKQGIFANNSGFSKRYPAISFEGAFCINYFFTPKYTPDSGITLYYWNAEDYNAASVLSTSNATGKFKLDGSGTGEYRGDIVGISARDLSEAVYVAAAYKSGGTVWTSGVLGYSIGAYCAGQASKGADVSGLAMATAVYGYHAKQYFG